MKISAHRLYGFLTLVWIATMLLLTLTPAQDMPVTPAWKLISFDTAAHAGVFAVLAGLSWLWLRGRPGQSAGRAAGLVLVGCVAFGASIEVLQYVMHQGRHAEWSDLLSDTIGTALVVLLLPLLRRRPPALAAGLLLALALPLRAQPTEPDLPRARRTIAVLASSKMRGRGYVRQGEHRAAAYLRGRLQQLALQPLAPSYTQPFTLDVNTFPGKLSLKLALSKQASAAILPRQVTLRPGIDFIAAPACPSVGLSTYYLNYPDTLAYQDAMAANTQLFSGRLDPAYGGALLVRARDETLLNQPANAALAAQYANSPHLDIVPKLTASLADGQEQHPQLEVLAASLPVWATSNEALVTLQVDARLRRAYPTQNLAAVVRGRTQPDSFLVVSAHYDHLGTMGKHVYFPGANDNASGVALLLELAAHYARPENQPACSVAFLLFGAEEAGLVGSTYFVQHPLIPLARIKFLLNLDLLGTGEEGATVVNGRTYPVAYQRLTALNDAHHYLPRLTARGPAANSDHFPFSEAGVPAFFMYTRGGSLAYHDVHDQPAALSLAGFAGAFGLARDFLNAQGAQ
ncbi:VanZ family protein [Hymenobacter psoromatis]|uniref:VanZ family protein n=1 Tax=Hymenobacter psoromatis TaxID=1484116 RepID=UPI001CC1156B|nr:VanZ family protein [Hymenobacter psoromatis]